MSISDLNIHHLRNIPSAQIRFHPQCNIFFGANGSGKTSLLEAIYLLGSGHSFRTRETSPLIRHGEPSLTVFGRTFTEETISLQKSVSGPMQVKLNRQPCLSSSMLARFLPCQVFYQDIFQIIDAGPSVRRTLLDWGLFHVEHTYHALWKDYRYVLKQRNALLRQKATRSYFVPWDRQLVTLAQEMDTLRSNYFKVWAQHAQTYIEQLTDLSCVLHYYKGWDRKESGKTLELILAEQFDQDMQRQYTHSGPHQADIIFDVSSKKAKLLLSRGQQKIVLIALKLAQARVMTKECVYLFDDVAAELDQHHLSRLVSCLQTIKGQVFITALDASAFTSLTQSLDHQSYSIEHGCIEPITNN